MADERAILRGTLRHSFSAASYIEAGAESEARRQAGDSRSMEAEKYDSGSRFTMA